MGSGQKEKKRRQHYFSLYKRIIMCKHKYSSFGNRANNENRYAKKYHNHKLILNIQNEVKHTWAAINKVLNSKSNKKNSNINSLLFNNRLYTDNFGISQAFPHHFTTIAERFHETILLSGSYNICPKIFGSIFLFLIASYLW